MRRYQAWKADNRGASIIIFALSLPILIGFVGLGVETSYWYLEKRELQEAVDSAALAGVIEKLHDTAVTQTRLDLAASAAITRSGFGSPTAIVVNNPPLSGYFVGDSSAVEAILTESYSTHFAAVVGFSALQIQTRAVAKINNNGAAQAACILSLHDCFEDANEGPGIIFQGSLDLTAPGCWIHSNDWCQGINARGNPTVTASCITADADVRNYDTGDELEETSRNFTLTECGDIPQVHIEGPDDPYLGLAGYFGTFETTMNNMPQADCADSDGDGGLAIRVFSPGKYCSSDPIQLLDGNGERNLFEPGAYYIESDIFVTGGSLESGFRLDGTTVAPVLIIQPHSNTFDFRGQGDLHIVGPAGATGFEDIVDNTEPTFPIGTNTDLNNDDIRDDAFAILSSVNPVEWSGLTLVNLTTDYVGESNNCPNKINGDGDLYIEGSVYYPYTCIVWTGNAASAASPCMQLIAGNITVAGNFSMNSNISGCDDSVNLAEYTPVMGLVE